jgi:hemerythrin-like domain-containing protein
MNIELLIPRRRFLCITGSLAAALALSAVPPTALAAEEKETEGKEPEVNPLEDLMREHGVLRRLLLIYEEGIKRLKGNISLPPGVIGDAAGIIRRFVEEYHEKLEEQEIFPRFEKAGKFVDLVRVLYTQHQAGRRVTDLILKLSTPGVGTTVEAREKLSSAMQQYNRMYRPHASREDTVLFPAFHSIASSRGFDTLGEKFEDKERALFGEGGFQKIVASVADIEKRLGIFELSQFTPSI